MLYQRMHTRAEGGSLYVLYNADANVVNVKVYENQPDSVLGYTDSVTFRISFVFSS